MKKIPVFLVGGFLDSGKTSYILHTLETDLEGRQLKTLLVCAEEGEIEYSEETLDVTNTVIRYIENFEEFNGKALDNAIKEVKPDRIIVELNGMWDIGEVQLPKSVKLLQTILFVDGTTFPVYFNNMRQKFNDMIKVAQVLCFTKVKDKKELEPYQTALRLINPNMSYFLVDEKYQISEAFEAPLPYDIESPVITIKDEDFGFFYIDSYDNRDRYEGKTVEFDCLTFVSDKFTDHTFLVGRWIMNCCQNDVQLFGIPAKIVGQDCPVKDQEWIHIVGTLNYEFSEQYNEIEIFITPKEITRIPAKEKVLNLTPKQ